MFPTCLRSRFPKRGSKVGPKQLSERLKARKAEEQKRRELEEEREMLDPTCPPTDSQA